LRRQDLRPNAKVETYQINWSWNKKTDFWLLRHCIGTTLHVCCGMSKIGDLRVDIDPMVKPDMICDVMELPFRAGSFETIICDPPFSLFNRFKWIYKLADMCTKRLIISAPGGIFPRLKGFKTEYKATIQRGNLFVRYWLIYTKKNHNL